MQATIFMLLLEAIRNYCAGSVNLTRISLELFGDTNEAAALREAFYTEANEDALGWAMIVKAFADAGIALPENPFGGLDHDIESVEHLEAFAVQDLPENGVFGSPVQAALAGLETE